MASAQTSVAVWADGKQVEDSMKNYKGLYRLLNVTMACSLAASLSLYPAQAEETATQAQEKAAAKDTEVSAQDAGPGADRDNGGRREADIRD